MKSNNDIIVIEDDPDDREILQQVFRETYSNFHLVFFDNAPSAFNYLMSIPDKPFIIISDINLPGLSGIEFKKKIDSTDYLRKKTIPFVFLTTADSQRVVEDAYQSANLQGYFKKQNLLKEIRNQVQCIMEYWTMALSPE